MESCAVVCSSSPARSAAASRPVSANDVNLTMEGATERRHLGCHAGSNLVFTVAADPTPRTVFVYAGAQLATARLDVSLSDDSAPAQMKTLSDMNGTTNIRYGNQNQAFAALLSATLQ